MYSQEIGDSEVDEVESPEVTKVPQVMVRPCFGGMKDKNVITNSKHPSQMSKVN